MKKQVHVYYSGRVQGVGFRFATEDIANNLGLAGWVKNLPDGRVETIAEGDEAVLNEFLSRIKGQMSYYINDIDAKWREATGKFISFNIAFD